MKNPERRDKIIDGTISTLKKVGGSDLLFGLFLVCEGLSLIYAPGIFPVFVVLSILIAYAFAFEWFFRVIRGEKTFWNVVQRIIIIILVIALLVYCGLMIFDEVFRVNVDRVIVCATTIIDGTQNLFTTSKIKNARRQRGLLMTFSVLCILYGVVYGIVGGAEANFFTTTVHGVVFIFMGVINVWIFAREYIENRRQN